MRIVCQKCSAAYAIDDKLVTPKGIRAQCPRCRHLQLVKSSVFGATRLGRYLNELKTRFPGPVVADMFCLLQLDLELAIRARGMLMAREEGVELPPDEALTAQLAERAYLEKSIGRTGLLALRPLQVTGDRDAWHQFLLGQARK